MNKIFKSKLILLIGLCAFFVGGCVATQTSTKSATKSTNFDRHATKKLVSSSKEGLMYDENIELPNNYDVNYFRKVGIAAYMEQIQFAKGVQKSGKFNFQVLNSLLENEISRTKRFTVFSRQTTAVDRENAYQLLRGTEENELSIAGNQNLQNPEWVLSVTSIAGYEKGTYHDHNKITFSVTVTANLTDPLTHEIKESFPPVSVKSKPKIYFESVSGKYLGGFKINDANQLLEAYKEPMREAIAILVNRVGNYFPCGGRVTNFRDGRFVIDRGTKHGFATRQPVIIFIDEDGIPTPIASAEITPSAVRGVGSILKWKNGPYAQKIRGKIEFAGKDYLQAKNIYAVSAGMPETWEY